MAGWRTRFQPWVALPERSSFGVPSHACCRTASRLRIGPTGHRAVLDSHGCRVYSHVATGGRVLSDRGVKNGKGVYRQGKGGGEFQEGEG